MQIDKDVKPYLVFSGDSILEALRKINENHSRIVFVVQENGVLLGALSDGDVRRWITRSPAPNLDSPVDDAMNVKFIARPVTESPRQIAPYFEPKFDLMPLTDEQGRLMAIARKTTVGLQLDDFLISDQSRAFIIAEIGNNHNGDIGRAKELVNRAIEAGANCVKFQMRDLASLYTNKGRRRDATFDLGSQYTLDLLNKFQLSNDALFDIFDYCTAAGILPLCTPWDLTSVKALNDFGLKGFKVASADLTNHMLLEALAATGKPLICSTGMSTEAEIRESVALLRRTGSSFALLHCNSTYPTPYKDVNLSYLPRLKEISGSVVGYSGHERGIIVPVVAVSMGARIIEKHITLNRELEGNDHKVSLLPEEFSEMVAQIRNIEEAIGSSDERLLTQGEMINRETLAKSLVINCDLFKGEPIKRHMIEIKSPGQGLQPNRIKSLIGRPAIRDLKAGDFFFETDLSGQHSPKRPFRFSRPFGVPARYHDYKLLIDDTNVDFIEFHLSYNDLEARLSDHLTEPLSIGYAVHCPELFAGDHTLDLASGDSAYLNHSINEVRRTVAVAQDLGRYFPATRRPVLILNAGGWTNGGFLSAELRRSMYDRISQALARIELSSVRLAIQTMPPFPWHFGGQSFHNLFLDPDEIVEFCNATGHKVCLDISHSVMACTYFKWNFQEFLEKVLPHSIHLHIADARGIDGEGVQIGKGDVDFVMLSKMLKIHARDVQFIPEVWQGHKNKGEGFWTALEFLERYEI